MPVIPLTPTYSNIPQFIDSLFSSDVRLLSTIQSAIQRGEFSMAFSDETQKVLDVWLAAWQAHNNLPYNPTLLSYCPESDSLLLGFLSQFIFQNSLCMQIPAITYQGNDPTTQAPVYQLQGYQYYDFLQAGQWQLPTITQFLTLLMCGAHFVFIQAQQDLPPGVSVEPYYERFIANTDLAAYRRHDPGNSHYTSVVNICGEYIPKIEGNTAPTSCPFFVAYLVCPTVSTITCRPNSYSTFMQLEGWEAIYPRHNTDYQTYNQTLWNISTFGSCAYSEKRGTTIFLAPASWIPQTNDDTLMAPYAGAETRQPWLHTELITLPSSHVALQSKTTGSG